MTMTQTTQDQLGAAVHQNRPMSKDGQLERMFSRLFRGLVYPQIWEDVAQGRRSGPDCPDGLHPRKDGGTPPGSNAGPASVTAVDLSPAHVALGRLKIAAAQHLSQAE
ncbi:MAG: DUF3419 domain-containing protein, partial [Pseudomonadota bacterium]